MKHLARFLVTFELQPLHRVGMTLTQNINPSVTIPIGGTGDRDLAVAKATKTMACLLDDGETVSVKSVSVEEL